MDYGKNESKNNPTLKSLQEGLKYRARRAFRRDNIISISLLLGSSLVLGWSYFSLIKAFQNSVISM